MKFYKVETPFVVRYFTDETLANRFYNSQERASISSFQRRNKEKIDELLDRIKTDAATDAYYREQFSEEA